MFEKRNETDGADITSARALEPHEYVHTVVIGGEPIPASTWELPDEDQMLVIDRLKVPDEIAAALIELAQYGH